MPKFTMGDTVHLRGKPSSLLVDKKDGRVFLRMLDTNFRQGDACVIALWAPTRGLAGEYLVATAHGRYWAIEEQLCTPEEWALHVIMS